MNHPEKSCIVEVRTTYCPNKWQKALFHWNGCTPTYAMYGTPISNVIEWRFPIVKGDG